MSHIVQVHKIFITVLRIEMTKLHVYWYFGKYVTAMHLRNIAPSGFMVGK